LLINITFRVCFRARVIPENIQKKQARDAKLLAHSKAAREAAKKERATKRATAAAHAEKYAKEYAAADKALIDSKRKAKAEGNFFVESQPKIAFVIRTRG
jgi:large subunit ribosomal protein L7e